MLCNQSIGQRITAIERVTFLMVKFPIIHFMEKHFEEEFLQPLKFG